METLAIGLWGCFYGGSFLVFCGAIFAYFRSMRRIGINASLTAIGPASTVTAFLGGLPVNDHDTLLRLIAILTIAVGALLVYQMLVVFGSLQAIKSQRRTQLLFALMALAAASLTLMFTAAGALLICSLAALVMALFAGGVSVRRAVQGDRLAWVAVVAVTAVLVAYCGLSYSVLYPNESGWALQAVCATAACCYVLAVAVINTGRYAYLLERQKIMEYGPAYDPITRLRSRSETGQMARDIFDKTPRGNEPLGVLVITIANLYALEKLHGTASVNSALFLMAARLKRAIPARVELGRLGFDGFLLIMRQCTDSGRLIGLAQDLNLRLHKAALLKTNPSAQLLESAHTQWTALAGIGVLHVKNPETTSFDAVTLARNLSRVATSYASHVAWFDHASGEMTELPAASGDVRAWPSAATST